LGAPVVLRVSLRPGGRVDDVTVNVSADEGLYIDPARSQLSAPSVGPDAPAEWTIEVTPTREGRHLVRIDVQGRIDGVRQAHSVVAPIRVATVAKPGADNSVTGV